MMDQFNRIIDRSHQTYEEYGEEYRRLNRLIIGFSVGAIAFVGSMFAPSAGRVSWLMTTALILYLLSAWLGLTVEYTVLARLENRLKKLSERVPGEDASPVSDDEYMEIPFSIFQSLSRDFPSWKLHSQITAFFLATVSVLLEFLLPRNADFLDVVGLVGWGAGLTISTIFIALLFAQIKDDNKRTNLWLSNLYAKRTDRTKTPK
ncbi:MAG: hypothetical protein OXI53_07050 [Nitrospira sp.]|nr:hypothetical protein [Nitrospira sp.]MDE0405054.1 hypothetical protein [Nitrospira sp.]